MKGLSVTPITVTQKSVYHLSVYELSLLNKISWRIVYLWVCVHNAFNKDLGLSLNINNSLVSVLKW